MIERIFEIQTLIKSINSSFLEKGSVSQEGSKEYFKHLEYVQNKIIEKKAKLLLYLLQLKIIDNFEQPRELDDLFAYLEKFNGYIPYIALKKADHIKLGEGYSFLYETDYVSLDTAVNQAIKPFQVILHK